jgi:hypothetical protein
MFSMFGVALLMANCTPDPDGIPAFRHQEFYERLKQTAESFTLLDGDWKEDFGDAAFYGPAFYAWAGTSEQNSAWLERAGLAHERNMVVVRDADLLTGDVNEIIMAALGMIEYMAATGDHTHLVHLNKLMTNLEELIDLMGGYLTVELVPGYAMETYGPVSNNGLVGLLFLQHAHLLCDENRERFVAFGQEIAARIRSEAFEGQAYTFSPDRPGLYLYPNVTMIILHTRLYQLTGEAMQLDRALAVYETIAQLRVETDAGLIGPGRYFSPYSAEFMGAQTENYTTLSSQNFVIFALSLLYQATGEPAFLEEIDPILDFLDEYLEGSWCLAHIHKEPCSPECDGDAVCLDETCTPDTCQSGILHHWMDGRLAEPHNPEFFCSGCNLQLLYSMWYRQEALE